MALIQVPSNFGAAILGVQGGSSTYVGMFSETDINTHISTMQPYSVSETTVEKIDTLWDASRTEDSQTYTPTAGEQANLQIAYYWYLWVYLWRLSRQNDNCPDECKDPANYTEKKNRAYRYICEALTALGITDPDICASASVDAGAHLQAFGVSVRTNCKRK